MWDLAAQTSDSKLMSAALSVLNFFMTLRAHWIPKPTYTQLSLCNNSCTNFSVSLCVHCLARYSVMRYKYLWGRGGFVLLKNSLLHKRKLLELSSYIFHGVGPLVDPFWSRVSRSLVKGLPWFFLPVGE